MELPVPSRNVMAKRKKYERAHVNECPQGITQDTKALEWN